MLEPRVIIIHDCRIYPCMQKNGVTVKSHRFLYTENPAIVAGLKIA